MSSATPLIEREAALEELGAALQRARRGSGGVVVVSGEAGAGKTSLVREFVAHAAGRPTILEGACDPLSVPRPFGPLIDAMRQVDPAGAAALALDGSRADAFAAALRSIDPQGHDGQVTVFIIEDLHWADDATLDLITFLGRRVAASPTLLVLTYREDEVGSDHPLRACLGELGAAIGARIRLDPLTPDGVARLVGDGGFDATALHERTGGNPFFVTEVLAAGPDVLPVSVRDAVLARALRLGPDARAVLDAAAIVPGRVEQWLLDAIASGGAPPDRERVQDGLDICVDRGLLRTETTATSRHLRFRHELARLATVEAISSTRRRSLHRWALQALERPPDGQLDFARLTFHADEAGEGSAVLLHAPRAARVAAHVGAHREAVRHLEAALRRADGLDPEGRVALWSTYATELTVVARHDDALAAWGRVETMANDLGDRDTVAIARALSAGPLFALGRAPEAEANVAAAATVIDTSRPSRAIAIVAARQSTMHMLARRFAEAETSGHLAIALAESIEDDSILAEVLIQSGIALAMSGDDDGLTRIHRGIAVATAAGNDELVALGLSQIGSGYGELRRYDVAVPALQRGVGFASDRELFASVQYLRAWLGRCELELGHWDEAAAIAGRIVHNPRAAGISRFVALLTLGWLRSRRGDPDVEPVLDEALELAVRTRHVQRLWPVAACRAEAAWLHGRLDAELGTGVLEDAAALAATFGYVRATEELTHWLSVADGTPRGDPTLAETPFGLRAAGEHAQAAERWAALGCPYEESVARWATGDREQLQHAHRAFDGLGAVPMRTRAADALRAAGAAVPRGATPSTRANAYGLTDREVEVLALVATGRTNRAIADHLGVSVRTVDHHVSHLLPKLGVRTRAEAAVAAERLGLL